MNRGSVSNTKLPANFLVVESKQMHDKIILDEIAIKNKANDLALEFASGIGRQNQSMVHTKMPQELRFYTEENKER